MIKTLYGSMQEEEKDQKVNKPSNVLMQSSIKLALLGRANSGKKTVAKQLKEVLGPDVAIMNIDEMVREAIEYISPKKAEEQVQDSKPKKGAKQAAEPTSVDIFEGKDTTSYKAIAL